jgi:hypothetical protein
MGEKETFVGLGDAQTFLFGPKKKKIEKKFGV